MVNKIYLKAVAFSLVFSLAVFFIINQLDSVSIGRLEKNITSSRLDVEESNLFFQILEKTKDKEKACSILKRKIDSQFGKNAGLLNAIDEANKSIFIVDFSLLKKSYFLSNAQLYLFFKQENEFCNENNQTILYFYRDQKPLCADCIVQGKILDEIRSECSNVKTFAFPVDLEIGIVELFQGIFDFEDVPSMVINDQIVLEGLSSKEDLLKNLLCEN